MYGMNDLVDIFRAERCPKSVCRPNYCE